MQCLTSEILYYAYTYTKMITFRTSALYSRNRVHRRCENINYRCTVLEKQAHSMFSAICFRVQRPQRTEYSAAVHSANGVATHICERTRNGKRTTRVSSELFLRTCTCSSSDASACCGSLHCHANMHCSISALRCMLRISPPCCGAVKANEAR